MSETDRDALARVLRTADHCHGIVTRDGEQDACGKPPVAIIDGRGTEDDCFWPACAYHAHRCGGGRVVTLAQVKATARAEAWDEAADRPTDLACCRIAVNCLAEHDRTDERLRRAIEDAIDSLTRWNVNGISLVVDANIRHLRRALDGDR